MARFDRYVLSQLLWLFGFFSLVLVLVYWVNRAVSLFDRLIANGHSALVFAEFTALSLPNVIRVVLPVSAFAASLYVTNRLAAESELVAVQATGYSPARLALPMVHFGLFAGLLMSVLTHVLVPLSTDRLQVRTAEISENATARLLTEGEFIHPSKGSTFYVREITPEGELLDIFLNDARSEDLTITYTATKALLLRHDDGPRLVMFDGLAQVYRQGTGRLSVTRFEDFTFNVGAIIEDSEPSGRSLRQIGTIEMLRDRAAALAESGSEELRLRHEIQSRVTKALMAAILPVLGFSILMLGSFSRFGMWRQMLAAIFVAILYQTLDGSLSDLVRRGDLPLPAGFVPALLGCAVSAAALYKAGAPRRLSRGRVAA